MRYSTLIHKDYYKTLGLKKNATSKEIKSAYYALSKIHHPDANPSDKDDAAVKFQKVSEAYEVLGSENNRKAYDSQFDVKSGSVRFTETPKAKAPKEYTDLDIDYKDFEHFQRISRRRTFRTLDGYSSKYYKDDASTWEFYAYANYKDRGAHHREEREKRMEAELEARKKIEDCPLPKFEELIQQKKKQRSLEETSFLSYLVATVTTLVLFFGVLSKSRKI